MSVHSHHLSLRAKIRSQELLLFRNNQQEHKVQALSKGKNTSKMLSNNNNKYDWCDEEYGKIL